MKTLFFSSQSFHVEIPLCQQSLKAVETMGLEYVMIFSLRLSKRPRDEMKDPPETFQHIGLYYYGRHPFGGSKSPISGGIQP